MIFTSIHVDVFRVFNLHVEAPHSTHNASMSKGAAAGVSVAAIL